jgi:hypothetical protein
MLIKKAVAVRKHLQTNRKDKDGKFRLILIESRIHRVSFLIAISSIALLIIFSSPATTRPSVPSPLPGGTRAPPPLPSSHKQMSDWRVW